MIDQRNSLVKGGRYRYSPETSNLCLCVGDVHLGFHSAGILISFPDQLELPLSESLSAKVTFTGGL